MDPEQPDAAPDAARIVDNQTVSQTVAAVGKHFAERISAGPTARSVRERQRLLRYANEVHQPAAGTPRLWALRTEDLVSSVRPRQDSACHIMRR